MGKVSEALNKAQEKPEFAPRRDKVSNGQDEQKIEIVQREKRILTAKPKSVASGRRQSESNREKWDGRLRRSMRNTTGVAESIRKLRTMLLHAENEEGIRSIMVLSSDPQEGKSFVSANLGISIAKSVEHQALLVDCDLRRPSLHNLFGIQQKEGLAEYLENGDEISSLICDTGMPELSVIPSGSPPENPAELLSSERMADFIEELTSQSPGRLVVLDTPPFHAASETILLSKMVDKIVLVVRWRRPGRENVKKMVDTIGREKIIGVVFNAFETNILDRKMQGVGYHNYYSEYY